MNILPDGLVVFEIAGNYASIHCPDKQKMQTLFLAGFGVEGDKMVRPITSDADRLDLVRQLINLGALFSDGTGWAPAEVVAMYKDNGAIKDSFLRISWKNPNSYIITPS